LDTFPKRALQPCSPSSPQSIALQHFHMVGPPGLDAEGAAKPTWDQRIMSPLVMFVVTGLCRSAFAFDVHGVR
jgi:hypothetical protein